MTAWIMSSNGSRNSEFPFWTNGAAGKAHFDVEAALMRVGVQKLCNFSYVDPNEDEKSLAIRFDGMFAGLKKDDVVFLQWPLSNSLKYINLLMDYIQQLVQATCVIIIHDINIWRLYGVEEIDNQLENGILATDILNELSVLSKANGLITHTKAMSKKLKQQINSVGLANDQQFVELGIFGYEIVKNNGLDLTRKNNTIDYAGTFNKAKFISDLLSKTDINLYGLIDESNVEKLNDVQTKHLNYKGYYDSQVIPLQLQGSFGLVWSSDTFPNCTGKFSEYEMYNAPHKLSLYLAGDEPVIVAARSAMADFVKHQNVGIIVEDLSNISSVISHITDDEYDSMLRNVHRIGNLIRTGFPIQKSFFEMISKLNLNC